MSDDNNLDPPSPKRQPTPVPIPMQTPRVPGAVVKPPSPPVPPPPPIIPETGSDPLIGRTLAGKYAFKSKLGAGGFGSVYLARHSTLGADVAVKVLAPRRQDRKDISQRFRREAKTLSRLRHPHIVEVLDFGNEDGLEYLVMEYLQGQELADVLDQPMEWRRALHIAKQIALALSVAHQIGIVHRDLKPANVMLIEIPGFKDHVKVLDFGIAKLLSTSTDLTMEDEGPTQGHQLLGTPTYMSPEQCRAEGLDGRADLYSLGAVLYRMLTGKAPYSGTNVVQVIAMHLNAPVPSLKTGLPEGRFPPGLDGITTRMLAKDPEDRYETAADLIEAIEAVERGDTLDTTVPAQASTRDGLGWLIGGLAAVAAISVGIVMSLQSPPDSTPVPTSVPAPVMKRVIGAAPAPAPVKLEIITTPPGVEVTLKDKLLGQTPLTYAATQDGKTLLDAKAYGMALDGHTVDNLVFMPSRSVDGRLTSITLTVSMKAVAPPPPAAPAPPPVQKRGPAKRTRRGTTRRRSPTPAKPKVSAPVAAPPIKSAPSKAPAGGLVIDPDL